VNFCKTWIFALKNISSGELIEKCAETTFKACSKCRRSCNWLARIELLVGEIKEGNEDFTGISFPCPRKIFPMKRFFKNVPRPVFQHGQSKSESAPGMQGSVG
jgi:hypothetical protein